MGRSTKALAIMATLLMLGNLACKDPDESGGGPTSGVSLYAFDVSTKKVLVWNDLNALFDDAGTPAPSRQMDSNIFTAQLANLAWGGMCVNRGGDRLYLVADNGNVVRVNRASQQRGTVPSSEVVSFRLDTSQRLNNSKFGQVAVDSSSSNDTLYVTENGDNGTRIWVVTGAGLRASDSSVELQALQTSGDRGGTGVAAGQVGAQAYAFGYFDGGNSVVEGTITHTGARLRRGNASAFARVIIGLQTALEKFGSLALDQNNGVLFVARHNQASVKTTPPILAFRVGSFDDSVNQPPFFTLGTHAEHPDLRVIAHSGDKEWLVALRSNDTGTTAYNTLWIWKSPRSGASVKSKTVSPFGTLLRGIALVGNN